MFLEKLKSVYIKLKNKDVIFFQCNICGKKSKASLEIFGREQPSCSFCGSTVRMRSIIHILSTELFNQSLILDKFPYRPELKGIGLSDWEEYARRLEKKLSYKNTYYHKPPYLDITADLSQNLEGSYDFIIASDVFEHVKPPVSKAFLNARRLLKSGGLFLLTVPYTKEGETIEHFPELYEFQIIKKDNKIILKNTTRDGRIQIFQNLIFHGGDGETIEMRRFSEKGLLYEIEQAGFKEIKIHKENYPAFGIFWKNDWSLPITART